MNNKDMIKKLAESIGFANLQEGDNISISKTSDGKIKISATFGGGLQEVNINDLMFKNDFVSPSDPTAVNLAEVSKKISGEDEAENMTLKYKDRNGEVKWLPFPIGVEGSSLIQKYKFKNITIGAEKDMESAIPLNDQVIISVKKLVRNETVVDLVAKIFNSYSALAINCSEHVSLKENAQIKSEYYENIILNEDGLKEIDISSFINVNECEVNL